MLYLIIFAVFLSLITFFMAKRFGNKIYVLYVLFFLVFAFLFEYFNEKDDKEQRIKILHFERGESLICNDFNISNKYFNYNHGTFSFVSKDNNKTFKNLIIKIQDCKVQNAK